MQQPLQDNRPFEWWEEIQVDMMLDFTWKHARGFWFLAMLNSTYPEHWREFRELMREHTCKEETR